jgi:hypothetical protein
MIYSGFVDRLFTIKSSSFFIKYRGGTQDFVCISQCLQIWAIYPNLGL